MNLAILDVDGTLLDNWCAEDACFADALREGLGIHTLATEWQAYEHVSDQGVAVEAFAGCFGAPPAVPGFRSAGSLP